MATRPSAEVKKTGRPPSSARLRKALHGELILPGDAQYEVARRVWNGVIDRRPAFVVRCADADDVARAVEFARQSRLEVAVRGGGHSPAGFATSDGGLVIDLSPMKAVSVSAADRSARAQAGLTLGALIGATQAHGLATPTGTVSDVGVGGLTLGGGVGLLVGKHGLTCDNVRAFEIVTADGRRLRASADENPDLFWGLRGGGGNFGVVTAFEFRLHPVGTVLAGQVVHPVARARDVLRFYRDFTREMPDELSAACGVLAGADGKIGIAIAACYCGDLAAGERALAPVRRFGAPLADGLRPMPYREIFSLLDPAYRAGRCDRTKGSGITALSDEVIDALAESAESMTSPYSQILILPVHGAASRVELSDTAFPFREKHYEVLHVAAWEDGDEEPHLPWLRRSWQALLPYASQRAYVNFLDNEGPARVRAAYGPNYARLAALKSKYDPDNLFHLNQNVEPDRGAGAGM